MFFFRRTNSKTNDIKKKSIKNNLEDRICSLSDGIGNISDSEQYSDRINKDTINEEIIKDLNDFISTLRDFDFSKVNFNDVNFSDIDFSKKGINKVKDSDVYNVRDNITERENLKNKLISKYHWVKEWYDLDSFIKGFMDKIIWYEDNLIQVGKGTNIKEDKNKENFEVFGFYDNLKRYELVYDTIDKLSMILDSDKKLSNEDKMVYRSSRVTDYFVKLKENMYSSKGRKSNSRKREFEDSSKLVFDLKKGLEGLEDKKRLNKAVITEISQIMGSKMYQKTRSFELMRDVVSDYMIYLKDIYENEKILTGFFGFDMVNAPIVLSDNLLMFEGNDNVSKNSEGKVSSSDKFNKQHRLNYTSKVNKIGELLVSYREFVKSLNFSKGYKITEIKDKFYQLNKVYQKIFYKNLSQSLLDNIELVNSRIN